MDALGLDVMHEEYQKVRQDVADILGTPQASRPEPYTSPSQEAATPSREVSSNSPSEALFEAEVGGKETVPVSDEVEHPQGDVSSSAIAVASPGRDSVSSSDSIPENNTSRGSSSFYNTSSMSPKINYDRDFPAQKLVAVIGRQFDEPNAVANSFQKLVFNQSVSEMPSMKFVPFTMKRRALLKGSFYSDDLMKHDLICMCYNASEARILLTGTDGFYTSLLKHTEAVLGPNKVAFLISNYNWSLDDKALISPALRTRLYSQEALRPYLDRDQILSWMDKPNESQVAKLAELADMVNNPQGPFNQMPGCCIL